MERRAMRQDCWISAHMQAGHHTCLRSCDVELRTLHENLLNLTNQLSSLVRFLMDWRRVAEFQWSMKTKRLTHFLELLRWDLFYAKRRIDHQSVHLGCENYTYSKHDTQDFDEGIQSAHDEGSQSSCDEGSHYSLDERLLRFEMNFKDDYSAR